MPPAPRPPTFWRLAVAGVWHHRGVNLAVMLGAAAATAVLTGALLVGDSMRGSLQHLVLDGLGRIDEVLVTDRLFRAELAEELTSAPGYADDFDPAVPAIMLPVTAENPANGRRASQVSLLGADSGFWKFATADEQSEGDFPTAAPQAGEVFVNHRLAAELEVAVGDECLLRLPRERDVPAESALGRKTDTLRTLRLKVARLVPDRGLGRFSLRPNQVTPANAYVDLATLQTALEADGRANAILVASNRGEPTREAHEDLQQRLTPRPIDYGVSVRLSPRGYFLVGSERMLFDHDVDRMVAAVAEPLGGQPVLAYLANTLAVADRETPYSTIAAIDFAAEPPLGPFVDADGKPIAALAADEIALNSWAAEDLGAAVGDTVSVTFFEPESTHGELEERTEKFRLAAIVDLTGAADDRDLTPTLPGVTDQLSIAEWDPPFPFDSGRVRKKDEDYWDEHRATPKAFVSLATGRRLWGSRFGRTTSWRIAPSEALPATEESAAAIAGRLKPSAAEIGFEFRPVKLDGLAAARGTTPFDGLFLGFSFFIIAAAVMLIVLLFRLAVERRAAEIGTLLAAGWSVGKVRRLLLVEGLLIAGAGAILGVLVGRGYAWLMLTGLRTWWVAAVSAPFLELYTPWRTLAIGLAAGVVLALLSIVGVLMRLRRISVRSLLAGRADSAASKTNSSGRTRWLRVVAVAAIALAVAAGFAASRMSGEVQAGAFMGAGALVLVALLAAWSDWLRQARSGSLVRTGGARFVTMAARNAARHPGRSTLTVGLVAAAAFLIIAISAFRIDPASSAHQRDSGTGGFTLLAESDQPLYFDPGTEEGRFELGFASDGDEMLTGTTIYSLRVRRGEDASCLNLYQTTAPRIYGVSEALTTRGGFAWAATATATDAERENPWLLLEKELPPEADGTPVVPAVIDAATAIYSLHLRGVGSRYEMPDGHGGRVVFEAVGLLKNSILQGAILVSERNLLRLFPDAAGYRLFLIETPDGKTAEVETLLEDNLGDFGFDAVLASDRLADYLAVQNTYLSTFQSLGGLGLLLGTFGLATVQLRNVLERRGELALLQAEGFRRSTLARIVLWENALLLVGGLVVGAGAALVAVVPHVLLGGAAIPWLSLAMTLVFVLLVGMLAGLVAVRATLRAPLLEGLRAE